MERGRTASLRGSAAQSELGCAPRSPVLHSRHCFDSGLIARHCDQRRWREIDDAANAAEEWRRFRADGQGDQRRGQRDRTGKARGGVEGGRAPRQQTHEQTASSPLPLLAIAISAAPARPPGAYVPFGHALQSFNNEIMSWSS